MISPSDISVVIPAYGPSPFLHEVLSALARGTCQPAAIYVSHSGEGDPTGWIADEFPYVTALHSSQRLFAGAARNRAAKMVGTPVIAFCDNDTVPADDWVEQAAAGMSEDPRAVLVGSVGTARSGGYWGMSTWLCEFSEQIPWRKGGTQNGGASCNLVVRTADLAAVGYFPEDFRAGQDTMLLYRLRENGGAQIFRPMMEVGHFNIPGFKKFARHLNNQGRHFAKVRLSTDMSGSFAVKYWPLSPLLGLSKTSLILKRLIGNGKVGLALMYVPGILLGIAIWTAGCAYAAATKNFTGSY